MPQKLNDPSVTEDSVRQNHLISHMNIVLQRLISIGSKILLFIIGIVKSLLIKVEIDLLFFTYNYKERFHVI